MSASRHILIEHDSPQLQLRQEVLAPRLALTAPHAHQHQLSICLVERGSVYGEVEGRLQHTDAGRFELIPPGILHAVGTQKCAVQQTVLHLPVARLQELAGDLGWSRRVHWQPSSLPLGKDMQALLQSLKQELNHPPGLDHQLVLESLSTAFMVSLLRLQGINQAPRTTAVHRHRQMAKLAECLRHDLDAEFKLEQLAEHTKMSRFCLIRSFKAEYGVTPHAYRMQWRVKKAEELMRSTRLSLTEIAFEAGFGSSSRLTEAFQKQYGVTPSLWRCANKD